MSSVYATEPATFGRIIFETSHGPLDVRLWARECPATVRLVLQLCRDGYYDDLIFHRIVPQLLIQTGAVRRRTNNQQPQQQQPSNEENAQLQQQYRQAIAADEALARRRYETNARIQFNHRGQVALAMNVQDDMNNTTSWPPQFFITTEAAEHLDGQHVIFGTLGAGGPTMFNAIRIAQTFTGDENAAAVGWEEDAPYIRSVKIVEHPFPEQMISLASLPGGLPWKQQQQPKEDGSQNAMPKKKKKRKGKLDVNVLSFGDEVVWEDGGGVGVATKTTKSNKKQSNRHTDDTTNDNHIDSASNRRTAQSSSPNHQNFLRTDNNIDSLSNGNDRHLEDPATAETDDAEEAADEIKDETMHNTVGIATYIPQKSKDKPGMDFQVQQSEKERGEKDYSQLTVNASSRNRKSNPQERDTVSLVEARRARYTTARRSKDKKQREEDTLARLEAFQTKVRDTVTGSARRAAANNRDDSLAARMARRADPQPLSNDEEAVAYHGQILENDDDSDDPNRWMRTKFKCRRHMDHEAAGDGRDALQDYKVVDDRGQRQQSTDGSHHHHQHKRQKHDYHHSSK